MGKQGKREFVQVLRLMEVFSAVYGPVFIAPSEKKAPPHHKRSGFLIAVAKLWSQLAHEGSPPPGLRPLRRSCHAIPIR
jgi:hypothetical protein